jgi:rfaE bifunctional protein kinase chain/domain
MGQPAFGRSLKVMNIDRIETILGQLGQASVTVIGDFFLDQYWTVENNLAEVSIETGLRSNQVSAVRVFPGAAGTIVNNLVALGVGRIRAIGFTGDDGPGFELRRALDAMGVDTGGLLSASDRVTPVYTKPMFRDGDGPGVEGERFDIKNRSSTSPPLERAIITALDQAVAESGSVIALDQIQEENCGVLTEAVRNHLTHLGAVHHQNPIIADSRKRIGQFRNVMIKPNRAEAEGLVPGAESVSDLLKLLHHRTGRTVFLTSGAEGIHFYDGTRLGRVGAVPVRGPIDTVGAGDTVSASLGSAFSVGASPLEAAQLAVLAASVTVRKIGMTGTATPAEILAAASGATNERG